MAFGIIPECRSAFLQNKRSASPESPFAAGSSLKVRQRHTFQSSSNKMNYSSRSLLEKSIRNVRIAGDSVINITITTAPSLEYLAIAIEQTFFLQSFGSLLPSIF